MTSHTSVKTPTPSVVPWLRIGVTGGIACGKSTVGAFIEAQGVAVIEADTVCHGLMRAGMPLFAKIVAAFGREIVAPDGDIDRELLGRRVFNDAAALGRLNAILHPAAQDAIEAWILARREEVCRKIGPGWRGGVVAIIPLLYEVAWEAAWDRVICVGAPVALQVERLRSKGFTEKEAHARIAAQWPVEEKMKRADYVVFNTGTQRCAQRQIAQVMQHIGIHVEKSDGR